MSILFESIFSFSESMVVYDAISLSTTGKKQLLTKCVILAVITTIIMQLLPPLNGFSGILFVGTPIIKGALAAKVLKVKVKYSVVTALLCLLIIHTYDSILITLLGIAIGEESILQMVLQIGRVRYLMGSVSKGTFLLMYWVIRRKIRNVILSNNSHLGNNFLFAIVIGGLIGVVYLSYQMVSMFGNDQIVSWVFFVICLILAVVLLYFYTRQKVKENTMKFIEQRNNILEENYNNIKELYESNAKLFHDFKNHIEVIKQLAKAGEDAELRKYLLNFQLPDNSLNTVKWTSDTTVNFLLNSKFSVAEQKNIKMTLNVDYPLKTSISSSDITTILANLIDNAIEANEKNVEYKSIHITIKPVNEMLIIKIVNTYGEEPVSMENGFLTSKENQVFHGWGLKSVQSTVDKYDGFLEGEFNNENKTFVVMVNLPFSR